MKRLRTLSTRRLIGLAVALVVLGTGVGIAQAALGGNPKPAPKPLDVAVHDALAAQRVYGITARVHFTNHLIPSGALPDGSASPLMAGASGRLWVTSDGRFRVELQSQAGDAQIVSDGKVVTAYDASSNTAYRFALPQDKTTAAQPDAHTPPTLAKIDQAIADVGKDWTLSGATPTSTAGQPTYTVRIAPKGDGGLLGAAELAWDATHGVPLRAAVYASGQSDPVLELRATRVSFGPVATSDVAVAPPAGAKIVDLSPSSGSAAGSRGAAGRAGADRPVTGVDAVQAAVPFKLSAPDQLAGLPRQDVWLAGHGDTPTAVITYGKGLGAIVVIERAAKLSEQPLGGFGAGGGDRHGLQLPTINVDGASGHELATALGTALSFQRGGVDYVVAGSIPAQSAETAARQLG
jgi:outer membrane lipoprotein-sorting protein